MNPVAWFVVGMVVPVVVALVALSAYSWYRLYEEGELPWMKSPR